MERDGEIRALERAVERLRERRGGVVVLDAAAGLGKTALIRRTRELVSAAGVVELTARGAELERDFTFGVVVQLVEPVLPRDERAREELFSGAAGAARHLFGAPGGTSGSLHSVLNGLYWLLVSLAERAPVLLLVDDAQWVDAPSLRFLGFLARRLDSVAVGVVLATRSAEHDDDGLLDDVLAADDVTVLALRSLSPEAVAALVRQELGEQADDEFCAACHRTTAGNPLFVRELLRVLVGEDVRPDADAAASVEAAGPDAVRRHVAARLRRQPEEVQRVARAVAVLGDGAALRLVAGQADLSLPVTAEASERLTRYGIFEREDPPSFVHAVVRDVTLSLIPPVDRDAAHGRAARVLARAGEPVANVASHLLRTAPEANAERVAVLLTAATQAARSGSPGGAAVYLARARTEPPVRSDRSEISRQLGNCQAHHLAIDAAEVHLVEALSLAETPAQRAVCGYSLARFRNACGASGEAIGLLAAAADELPAGVDPALEVEVGAELVGITRGHLASRAEFLARLDVFARRADGPRAVVDAHLSVEAVCSEEPIGRAVALARSALVGDDLTPERSAIWSAVSTLVVADRLDDAEWRVQRALATAVQRGHQFPMGVIRSFLARISLLKGDLAQAAEHVALGTEAAPAPNIGLPLLHSTSVHLLIEEGRFAEAGEVIASGRMADGRLPETVVQVWLLDARARLHAARGADEAALADALACGDAYGRWGTTGLWDAQWRLTAAAAHLRLGDRESAAALVEEQLLLARRLAVPRHIATALRSAADLATPDEARLLLDEAVDLLRDGPGRLELATTLAALGERAMRDGDRRTARDALRRAAELALECGASALAARLSTRLSAGGGRPPKLRVTGVHALTPAERQVARLAAAALTNREIAERLFVTEKTVEAHLSRVYRKLDVRSRTQLALHADSLAR
ncbi:LuxR C-terminal-related transcriptional regulator [Umezawaea sp. Da 62-37]|uniref:ATP-binding protein n=1 Tax=Umezawaea sp. Da 62-37 TaxID=3075927 RepID=UPI0028F6C56B|nr:LuxR C-terminal-related transcriptional regulator [Umezawaea sp. Da 62-37]WNV85700.1 LuxR C-terminal-related transcriptional regulator [Umezawaea sp. Da 62-37]